MNYDLMTVKTLKAQPSFRHLNMKNKYKLRKAELIVAMKKFDQINRTLPKLPKLPKGAYPALPKLPKGAYPALPKLPKGAYPALPKLPSPS